MLRRASLFGVLECESDGHLQEDKEGKQGRAVAMHDLADSDATASLNGSTPNRLACTDGEMAVRRPL